MFSWRITGLSLSHAGKTQKRNQNLETRRKRRKQRKQRIFGVVTLAKPFRWPARLMLISRQYPKNLCFLRFLCSANPESLRCLRRFLPENLVPPLFFRVLVILLETRGRNIDGPPRMKTA